MRERYVELGAMELAGLVGSTPGTVRTLACRYGVTKKGGRTYRLDESFFDVIDNTVKAYWLGFLYADCSIGYQRGVPANLRLEIHAKDAEHVEQLRRDLSCDAPITRRRNTATLIACSARLAQAMAALAVRPKFDSRPWEHIPSQYVRDFIRGVFDGDGSVYSCGGRPRCEFLGSRELCEFIRSTIAESTEVVGTIRLKKNSVWQLYFDGRRRVTEVTAWLYEDADRRLDRKAFRAAEILCKAPISGGALPNSVNVASPAGTDSPSLGDDQFRDLKTFLEDIFSIPDNTNISNAGLDFVAGGLQTVMFQDAAANPGIAGYLQRNAANLVWHDGTAAGRLFYAGGTDVPVADGGTALSSGTSGGILGFTGSTTLASSVALTLNAIVIGGGAGATPTPMTGTSGGVPYFNAATTVASSGALTANGVVYGGGAGAAPASTAQGGTRTILTANAGAPAWSATPIINTSVQVGVVSSTTGSLSLANSASANLTTFQAGNATEANTYVWPVDGGSANQVLTTDGATPTTVLTWTTVTSVSAATQAEMEAGSSTTVYVSPGRAHFHPSASKVWAVGLDTTISASYNVTSFTDNGVGSWTVNFTTSMSGSSYAAVCAPRSGGAMSSNTSSPGTGSVGVNVFNDSGVAVDPSSFSVVVFGDI